MFPTRGPLSGPVAGTLKGKEILERKGVRRWQIEKRSREAITSL